MAIPNGVTRITYGFTGTGVPTGAAVSVVVDQPPTPIPLEDIEPIAVAAISDLMANTSSSVVLSSILIKDGPDETGPSALFPANLAGSSSAAAVPPNVSVLISKITAFGGRRGRGRMYWPGVPEARVTESGLITGTDLSNFQASAQDMFDTFDAADLPLMLEHADGSQPNALTSLQVQSRVATQRRRLRR